jgi:O-antigen biosynthesis protein WbqV
MSDGSCYNLRTVSMEALLGRDKITHSPDLDELLRTYHGKRILVTGAGGSIGSELVRQLRACQPSEMILLDKDENTSTRSRAKFEKFRSSRSGCRHSDRDLMGKIFARFIPEIVFHAQLQACAADGALPCRSDSQ